MEQSEMRTYVFAYGEHCAGCQRQPKTACHPAGKKRRTAPGLATGRSTPERSAHAWRM